MAKFIASKKYPGVVWYLDKGKVKHFYVRFRNEAGKQKNVLVGTEAEGITEAKASAIRTRLMSEKAPTIKWLWDKYCQSTTAKRIVRTDRYTYAKYLHNKFGELEPSELSVVMIDDFVRSLAPYKLAPATINSFIALLRRIINFGIKCGYIDKPGHLTFNMLKVDGQKTEMLTKEQTKRYIEALDAAKNKVGSAFLKILMLTGMRSSALCALRWSDCDFENNVITLRGENAKNSSTAHIPMSQMVKEIILGLPRKSKEWIFPSKYGTGHQKAFTEFARKIKKIARLPEDFRPTYCLRHNFASQLACSGKVDLYTIQRALTHKSIAMTERYAHLSDEVMRRASEVATEQIIGGIIEKN